MKDTERILPLNFRKLSLEERRTVLMQYAGADYEEMEATRCEENSLHLADIMVESCAGSIPVPFGIVRGLIVNEEELVVPLATEEPSVVAAAGYAASIIGRAGGFRTWATDPVMTAQIIIEDVPLGAESAILDHEGEIRLRLDEELSSLKARGGGYRRLEVLRLPETNLVRVHLFIDVRDAMGANILDTAAEMLKPTMEALTGGKTLMCILTNQASERRAGAMFRLPIEKIPRRSASSMPASEIARRVALASDLAFEDRARAITHNKGIMNGISALAVATGNDFRAVEASAHAWASRDGVYRGLSRYRLDGDTLEGSLEMPLPFGSLGGAVGFHPATRLALKVLGDPDSRTLSRIAAALGLAQNFAALLALVTGGIQRGHMKHHAARLAYKAGARRDEIARVAELVASMSSYNLQTAAEALSQIRKQP